MMTFSLQFSLYLSSPILKLRVISTKKKSIIIIKKNVSSNSDFFLQLLIYLS